VLLNLGNFGYILVPVADGINHESLETEHPDVEKSQIAYQRGKVVSSVYDIYYG